MEEINLNDMDFDFEDYFERFRAGEMGDDEKEEFDARVLGLFCQSFIKSRGDSSAIPKWVAEYMCEQIYKVLAGLEFCTAFRMPEPWQQPTPIYSRAEESAISIFCDIANLLKGDASIKVTNAIAAIAIKRNVSYETARAAYYKRVKSLPSDFLKRDKEK